MNRIEIKPSYIDYNMGVLTSELLVDGVHLAPKALVDLRYLTKSAQTSGYHDIFTCSCGCAMCAGIDEPIFVNHLADAIEWHYKTIDCFGGDEDLDDADYDRLNTSGVFRFDPEEYRNAIEERLSSVRAAISLLRDIRSPSVDYPQSDLALLRTDMFSDRDCVNVRRSQARDVVFRASDGMWITADGIPYSVTELALPSELVELYRVFEAAQCFPQSSSDVGDYELFLEKGRRFGTALRMHLGKQCSVKLWYRYGRVVKPEVWSVVEKLA